jgi:hypothetical protein
VGMTCFIFICEDVVIDSIQMFYRSLLFCCFFKRMFLDYVMVFLIELCFVWLINH